MNEDLKFLVDAAWSSYCNELKKHKLSKYQWKEIRGMYMDWYGYCIITDGKRQKRFIKEIDIMPEGWYYLKKGNKNA